MSAGPRSARSGVDGRAVGAGVLAALAVAVPALLATQVLDQRRSGGVSTTVVALAACTMLAAMAVGGAVAGRRAPSGAAVHGAAAAAGAFVVVQVLAVVRLVADGDDVTWLAIPVFALFSVAIGIVAAQLAGRTAT